MSTPHNDSTRRDFLKTSSLAVGAGLVTGFAGNARAYAAGDETLKIGLIGCGGRGGGAAEQALKTKGNVKLIAMADAFENNLHQKHEQLRVQFSETPEKVDVPKEYKFVGFDAYQKLCALKEIDVVVMATPPGFRPIHFEAAVKAGKHVFAEKPVATDAPGVRKFLAAVEEAKKKNLKVGIGLQRHHQRPYLETIKRIKDGMIGDVIALRVYWNSGGVWVRERQKLLKDKIAKLTGKPFPKNEEAAEDLLEKHKGLLTEMEYQMRNWYYFNWLCGDHITEQHIHNLDVGNWVKSEVAGKLVHPVRANGMGGRQVRTGIDHGEIYDHHAVEFEYADGSRMFSQCRHIRNCWNPVTEHAHGSKGYANLSGASIDAVGMKWRNRVRGKNPYQQEHDDLFAAIRNNTPYNEGDYGATSTMISILGRMATYSGQPVDWDKAINSKLSIMPKDYSFTATPPTVPDKSGRYPIPTPGVTKVL
jgi:predicted dehydrogenase